MEHLWWLILVISWYIELHNRNIIPKQKQKHIRFFSKQFRMAALILLSSYIKKL